MQEHILYLVEYEDFIIGGVLCPARDEVEGKRWLGDGNPVWKDV